MTPAFRTTGNPTPHIVHTGYVHTPSVPGPLTREKEPLNYWLIGLGPLVALIIILIGEYA